MRAEARKPVRVLWVLGLFMGLVGCSPYRLQGVVVGGDRPGVEVVKANDPRLESARLGVPGVSLKVLLDPERLSPELLAEGATDARGGFALPVDEPGAGLLMLDIEVQASREGFASVRERLTLPGSNQRLIITLSRGEDARQLEADNVLEDTLRDAAPYLRD